MLKRVNNGYELESAINLAAEQQERFEEIKYMPAGFISDYENYVLSGDMPDKVDEDGAMRNLSKHPMRDMMIAKENDELKAKAKTYEKAIQITTRDMIKEGKVSVEDLSELVSVYPSWEIGTEYKAGDIVAYKKILFEIIQAHTSQADWTPDKTPALFKSTLPEGEIGEWVQPTGGHDDYNAGDKVLYNGIVWVSKIDANTTVPDGDEPYNRYWEPE